VYREWDASQRPTCVGRRTRTQAPLLLRSWRFPVAPCDQPWLRQPPRLSGDRRRC